MKIKEYIEKDKVFQKYIEFETKRKHLEKQLNIKRMQRAVDKTDVSSEIKDLCQRINIVNEAQKAWLENEV